MKIILVGGTGQLGRLLEKSFLQKNHHVCVISRSSSDKPNHFQWNSKTMGEWAKEIENANVVINLAGRSVNCRYTKKT